MKWDHLPAVKSAQHEEVPHTSQAEAGHGDEVRCEFSDVSRKGLSTVTPLTMQAGEVGFRMAPKYTLHPWAHILSTCIRNIYM